MTTRTLTTCFGLLIALLLAPSPSPALSSLEQNSDQPAASPDTSSRLQIPPGTVISAVLTKSVEAKKAKVGDEVVAKVQSDIKNKAGEVLVPKDTRLMGKVTEVQPRSKEQKESRVGLVFDHAVLKDGSQFPLSMSIQAIADLQEAGAGPQGANDSSQQPGSYSGGGVGGGGMGGGGMRGGYGGSSGSMERQPAPAPSAGSGDTGGPPRDVYQRTVTPQTQGVIGIPDTQLSPASGSTGSLVTCDKSNVRLGSGTVVLLRVSQ